MVCTILPRSEQSRQSGCARTRESLFPTPPWPPWVAGRIQESGIHNLLFTLRHS